MKLDKDKIKESLTIEEIKMILSELGSNEPNLDKKGNLVFQTVCHGGSKHKLYYFEDSKNFHCFTDCGDTFDIYDLIARAKKIKGDEFSFYDSVRHVASLTGKYFSLNRNIARKNNKINDWEWMNKFVKKKEIDTTLPIFNENVLDVFLNLPHEEWLNEGISYETMQKFEIGYYIREEKITIPHRNIDNELIGIRGRAMLQEDIDNGRKYMPLMIQNVMYSYATLYNLYGINKTKQAVKRFKKVIIFEGEKSVLKCEDMYRENNFSVATCSSNISNWQRDLILSLGVEEVFIAFDKEYDNPHTKEAEKHFNKLSKLASKFTPYVKTYLLLDSENLLDRKDSPVDKGINTLEKLLKSKYEIKTSEVIYENT